MTESEMRFLVQEQLNQFADPRAIHAVKSWKLLIESAPNAWLLYRVNDDIGIAYSLSVSWAETPWAVVDGFSDSNPSTGTYCAELEDAVREVIYDGNIPPPQAELDAREAAMEKTRQKQTALSVIPLSLQRESEQALEQAAEFLQGLLRRHTSRKFLLQACSL